MARNKKLPIEFEVQDSTAVTTTDSRGTIGWIVKRSWNKHFSFQLNHKFDCDLTADELRHIADAIDKKTHG